MLHIVSDKRKCVCVEQESPCYTVGWGGWRWSINFAAVGVSLSTSSPRHVFCAQTWTALKHHKQSLFLIFNLSFFPSSSPTSTVLSLHWPFSFSHRSLHNLYTGIKLFSCSFNWLWLVPRDVYTFNILFGPVITCPLAFFKSFASWRLQFARPHVSAISLYCTLNLHLHLVSELFNNPFV